MWTPAPERCKRCGEVVPPEWVPDVLCGTRLLAGTGVWRSALTDGLCSGCYGDDEFKRQEAKRLQALKLKLVSLLGGEKPYREFRFETFQVNDPNQAAFVHAKAFSSRRDNLYLWGACGVGKTHLAGAIARTAVEHGESVELLRPPRLMRKVRRSDGDEEEQALTRLIRSEVFVLDDLGIGNESSYARQVFQEIVDGRDYNDRAGLVVTSKFSLDDLARRLRDDTIPSRLAGMCRVIQMAGPDWRLLRRQSHDM